MKQTQLPWYHILEKAVYRAERYFFPISLLFFFKKKHHLQKVHNNMSFVAATELHIAKAIEVC